MFGVLLFLISILLFLYLEGRVRWRGKNDPPGPIPWPVVGNIPSLIPDPKKQMHKLRMKYGDIMTFDFGYYRSIIVSNPHYVRELFRKKASTGAAKLLVITEGAMYEGNGMGLMNIEAETHSELATFLRKEIKELSGNGGTIEKYICEEREKLLRKLWEGAENEDGIQTVDLFDDVVVNLVWRIMTGREANDEDLSYKNSIASMVESFKTMGPGCPGFFFPWLCKILPEWSGWAKVVRSLSTVQGHISDNTNFNETTLGNALRGRTGNILDSFLRKIQEAEDPASVFHGEKGRAHLKATFFAFFWAGMDTTSATLCWAILYMTKNPGVQEKLQEEVDEIVGSKRASCLSDRFGLKYVNSFITEVLRISAIATLSVPHKLLEDVNFHGYTLRKDTLIMSNLYEIMHDTEYWGPDADEFRPERFMEATDERNPAFMPFAVGKRMCIGESVARDELFLFVTGIVQNFNITLENPNSINFDSDLRELVQKPFPFKIRLEKRHGNLLK